MFTCVKAFIKGDPSSIMRLGHQQIATKNFDSYSEKHFLPSSMPFHVHELICVSYFSPSSVSHLPFLFQIQIVSQWSTTYILGCEINCTNLHVFHFFQDLFLLSVCFLEFTTISFWIGLIMKFNSIQRWYKSSHKKNMKHFLNAPFHYHPTKIKTLNNSFSWTLDSIFNDNVF